MNTALETQDETHDNTEINGEYAFWSKPHLLVFDM